MFSPNIVASDEFEQPETDKDREHGVGSLSDKLIFTETHSLGDHLIQEILRPCKLLRISSLRIIE